MTDANSTMNEMVDAANRLHRVIQDFRGHRHSATVNSFWATQLSETAKMQHDLGNTAEAANAADEVLKLAQTAVRNFHHPSQDIIDSGIKGLGKSIFELQKTVPTPVEVHDSLTDLQKHVAKYHQLVKL